MARKVTDGPIRNKERTQKKLIAAVGKVLRRYGHQGISVANIAKEAKVNVKLVYHYFGSLDKLVEVYIKSNDYWNLIPEDLTDKFVRSAGLEESAVTGIMHHQLDFFYTSREMQKIILWEINEKNKLMREIADGREQLAAELFKKSDITFAHTNIDFRAIEAILVAGVYYLVLHAKSNGSTFCELDINQDTDRNRIKNALSYIVNHTFNDSEKQQRKKKR